METANDDYDIDDRQVRCHRKFEKIVNQFDELIQAMDAAMKPPKPKRRRVTSNPKSSRSAQVEKSTSNSGRSAAATTTTNTTTFVGSSSSAPEASNYVQTDKNGVLVTCITRHLNDLKTDDNLFKSSTSSFHRK